MNYFSSVRFSFPPSFALSLSLSIEFFTIHSSLSKPSGMNFTLLSPTLFQLSFLFACAIFIPYCHSHRKFRSLSIYPLSRVHSLSPKFIHSLAQGTCLTARSKRYQDPANGKPAATIAANGRVFRDAVPRFPVFVCLLCCGREVPLPVVTSRSQ